MEPPTSQGPAPIWAKHLHSHTEEKQLASFVNYLAFGQLEAAVAVASRAVSHEHGSNKNSRSSELVDEEGGGPSVPVSVYREILSDVLGSEGLTGTPSKTDERQKKKSQTATPNNKKQPTTLSVRLAPNFTVALSTICPAVDCLRFALHRYHQRPYVRDCFLPAAGREGIGEGSEGEHGEDYRLPFAIVHALGNMAFSLVGETTAAASSNEELAKGKEALFEEQLAARAHVLTVLCAPILDHDTAAYGTLPFTHFIDLFEYFEVKLSKKKACHYSSRLRTSSRYRATRSEGAPPAPLAKIETEGIDEVAHEPAWEPFMALLELLWGSCAKYVSPASYVEFFNPAPELARSVQYVEQYSAIALSPLGRAKLLSIYDPSTLVGLDEEGTPVLLPSELFNAAECLHPSAFVMLVNALSLRSHLVPFLDAFASFYDSHSPLRIERRQYLLQLPPPAINTPEWVEYVSAILHLGTKTKEELTERERVKRGGGEGVPVPIPPSGSSLSVASRSDTADSSSAKESFVTSAASPLRYNPPAAGGIPAQGSAAMESAGTSESIGAAGGPAGEPQHQHFPTLLTHLTQQMLSDLTQCERDGPLPSEGSPTGPSTGRGSLAATGSVVDQERVRYLAPFEKHFDCLFPFVGVELYEQPSYRTKLFLEVGLSYAGHMLLISHLFSRMQQRERAAPLLPTIPKSGSSAAPATSARATEPANHPNPCQGFYAALELYQKLIPFFKRKFPREWRMQAIQLLSSSSPSSLSAPPALSVDGLRGLDEGSLLLLYLLEQKGNIVPLLISLKISSKEEEALLRRQVIAALMDPITAASTGGSSSPPPAVSATGSGLRKVASSAGLSRLGGGGVSSASPSMSHLPSTGFSFELAQSIHEQVIYLHLDLLCRYAIEGSVGGSFSSSATEGDRQSSPSHSSTTSSPHRHEHEREGSTTSGLHGAPFGGGSHSSAVPSLLLTPQLKRQFSEEFDKLNTVLLSLDVVCKSYSSAACTSESSHLLLSGKEAQANTAVPLAVKSISLVVSLAAQRLLFYQPGGDKRSGMEAERQYLLNALDYFLDIGTVVRDKLEPLLAALGTSPDSPPSGGSSDTTTGATGTSAGPLEEFEGRLAAAIYRARVGASILGAVGRSAAHLSSTAHATIEALLTDDTASAAMKTSEGREHPHSPAAAVSRTLPISKFAQHIFGQSSLIYVLDAVEQSDFAALDEVLCTLFSVRTATRSAEEGEGTSTESATKRKKERKGGQGGSRLTP